MIMLASLSLERINAANSSFGKAKLKVRRK
jgi:hypothetical protein